MPGENDNIVHPQVIIGACKRHQLLHADRRASATTRPSSNTTSQVPPSLASRLAMQPNSISHFRDALPGFRYLSFAGVHGCPCMRCVISFLSKLLYRLEVLHDCLCSSRMPARLTFQRNDPALIAECHHLQGSGMWHSFYESIPVLKTFSDRLAERRCFSAVQHSINPRTVGRIADLEDESSEVLF